MPRKKTSIIWKTDKDELQKLIDASSSICDVLKKLGYKTFSKNYSILRNRIKEDNLDIRQMNINKNNQIKIIKSKNSNDSVFKINSTYDRGDLKRRIIKEK